jgi:hypothetical protein
LIAFKASRNSAALFTAIVSHAFASFTLSKHPVHNTSNDITVAAFLAGMHFVNSMPFLDNMHVACFGCVFISMRSRFLSRHKR